MSSDAIGVAPSTRDSDLPRPRRRSRRHALSAVAGALAFLAATALGAAPASAHDTSLPDAAYYRSTVTSVTPPVQGLKLDLTASGETVTLTNHTGKTVMVLGYEGEDYLRVTSTGVEENTNSLSAFLNGSLVIQGLPQQLGQTSPSQPPSWKHVADSPAFSWHDHRIHWMAQQRPPVVAADPAAPHHVFDWAVQLRVDGQPVAVKGSLNWIGAPRFSGLTLALWVVIGVASALGLAILLLRVFLNARTDTGPRELPEFPVLDDVPPGKPATSPLPDR